MWWQGIAWEFLPYCNSLWSLWGSQSKIRKEERERRTHHFHLRALFFFFFPFFDLINKHKDELKSKEERNPSSSPVHTHYSYTGAPLCLSMREILFEHTYLLNEPIFLTLNGLKKKIWSQETMTNLFYKVNSLTKVVCSKRISYLCHIKLLLNLWIILAREKNTMQEKESF